MVCRVMLIYAYMVQLLPLGIDSTFVYPFLGR